MSLTFTGYVHDFRPLIKAEVFVPGGLVGERLTALVDTGATDCVIRPALLEKLGLPVTETVHTRNIGSEGAKRVTRIDVLLRNLEIDRWWRAEGARAIVDEFDPCADMIIGMNVLRKGTLTLIQGVPKFRTRKVRAPQKN